MMFAFEVDTFDTMEDVKIKVGGPHATHFRKFRVVSQQLGANASNIMASDTNTVSVVAATKAVVTMAPVSRLPSLKVKLVKTLGLVEEKWGSARQVDLRAAASTALLPHINLHERNKRYD